MTTLLTVSVILFGVIAFKSLPVNDLPAVDYPVIQVQVNYPGASPSTMANNVATPLERQFMQINGLELVTSQSSQGHSSFTLQFALNKSVDAAATDVQTAITQATGQLPVDLPSPPTFSKTNPNDQAILYIALATNSVTAGKLYDYGSTQVAQRISILPGVSRVDIYGTKSAIRIKVDPSAMAIRGITIDDLADAIGAGTTYQAAGQFDSANRTFLLQPKGQLESASEYNNLIISRKNGANVYLRDVAEATDSVADERVSMHFWARGHETPSATVVLGVYRQAGANAVEVAASVRNVLPLIELQLPPSVLLAPIYDRSLSIVHSVADVEETLIIAFALVVIVIFVFLGRATDTLIPSIALPLSLLLTFLAMSILGYSLDNLSLMALTLAIGFLVDDAIVFLENTVRRMELGENALDATINSAKEISFTILSMTISLAVVFLPLVFMPGLVGRIFREFAVTIIVSIIASGLVSLTLTPLMCARLLATRGEHGKKTLMERFANAIIDPIIAFYGRTLTWFLKHVWVSVAIWLICFAGTVALFYAVPQSFLPLGDSSFIFGFMIGQQGTSHVQMHEYQTQADKIMQADPNVDVTFSMTGNSQFLQSNQGILLAFLKDPSERPPLQTQMGEIKNPPITSVAYSMQGNLAPVPAFVVMNPQPVLQISTGATANLQGEYAYTLSGIDPEETYAVSRKLKQEMMGFTVEQNGQKIPGFAQPILTDLYDSTPNLEIEILRDQASTYGISVSKIEALLRKGYSQNYLYLIKRPEDQYQVIMEVEDKNRANPDDLRLLYVRSDDGKRVIPLSAVTRWKQTVGPQSVNHINQFTSVTIFFNLTPGVAIGDATAFLQQASAKVVPPQIRGALQGKAKDFEDTMGNLVVLMILAVFVMYVILGILYESYIHPVTVLSSLPVAIVGGLLTLYLFHETASLYAFIGVFMLMGIVKKNGIMMIDFALQRKAEGRTNIEAIHDASIDRFRPIIMTTLAALMGALPIALGFGADGASRRPLGLIIVGGLLVSQFITLYVTPALYLVGEAVQMHVLDRIPFFRAHHAGMAGPGPGQSHVSAPIPFVRDSRRSAAIKPELNEHAVHASQKTNGNIHE